MLHKKNIITATAKWVKEVVIKNNFCPFAAAELAKNSIHYQVLVTKEPEAGLLALAEEWKRLEKDRETATSLLIFPELFPEFNDFLDFLSLAEALLEEMTYEGVFQIASFHPEYQFAGSTNEDPANYTNRSPYPMIHILREDDVEKVLQTYLHPERIPLRNIELARKLGLEKMQAARRACLE